MLLMFMWKNKNMRSAKEYLKKKSNKVSSVLTLRPITMS